MKNTQKTLKTLAISAFAFGAALASAQGVEKIPSTLHLGVLPKVGAYKVRVDNYGEPAALPLRVSANIVCGLDEKSTPIVDDLAACGFGSLEASGRNLVLNILKANPKTEKCDVKEAVKVANVCAK